MTPKMLPQHVHSHKLCTPIFDLHSCQALLIGEVVVILNSKKWLLNVFQIYISLIVILCILLCSFDIFIFFRETSIHSLSHFLNYYIV
jgi:hypothetical protein